MTILYVGNFTQKHCTEVHIAATLEDLGHEVIRVQENGITSGELTVLIAENAASWDMFLFTRTWGETVKLYHLTQLYNLGVPTVSYHLDLYVGLSRKYLHGERSIDEVLQSDPFWRTDFVFTPDGDPRSQEVFERNGVKHFYMKPGVFKSECVLGATLIDNAGEPNEKALYKHEVLFVGGGDRVGSPHGYGHPEWPYRDELITWLYNNYEGRFTKLGHPQETVRNAELNQLYANSKVVVGDSVCINFDHEHYWSDRVYETIGRGGFLIHPYIKGLEEEFKDGETIVFYEFGNWDDLKQKIDYYLEHDDEREHIRRAGHEFVKNNATYHDRLSLMLDVVFKNDPGKIFGVPTKGQPIKINLGAGSEPSEGWVNLDWIEGPGIDVIHNLLEFPWPFDDDCADEIKAIDVLEHMPNFTPDNQAMAIAFVESCHRILKPGGKLFITVPHWQSKNLWIDPTHVRGYDEKSFDYFDPDKDFGKNYGYYSKCKFFVSSVRTPNDNCEFTMVKQ